MHSSIDFWCNSSKSDWITSKVLKPILKTLSFPDVDWELHTLSISHWKHPEVATPDSFLMQHPPTLTWIHLSPDKPLSNQKTKNRAVCEHFLCQTRLIGLLFVFPMQVSPWANTNRLLDHQDINIMTCGESLILLWVFSFSVCTHFTAAFASFPLDMFALRAACPNTC